MANLKFKVVYNDGQEKTIRVTPRAEVMTEEKYAGIEHSEAALRIVYHLAWASLNRAGQEPDDFETWLDKIADLEDVTKRDEELDPMNGAEQPLAPSSG